jgi:hypothetical protein
MQSGSVLQIPAGNLPEAKWSAPGRAEVARQQTTYDQPSHPGFHLASGTGWSRVPRPAGRGRGDR